VGESGAEAQKERTVVAYADMIPEGRDAVRTGFSAKYGINVEWVAGRPAELVARIRSEKNAGLNLTDVGFFGVPSLINDVKPMGLWSLSIHYWSFLK